MGAPIDVEDPDYNVPRRNDIDRMTKAELAIRRAVLEVERVGADPLLTEAVMFLVQAKEAVADYVDQQRDRGKNSASTEER